MLSVNPYCYFLILLIIPVNLFSQQPKLVIPVGHVNKIINTRFSPDSKLIATTSDDKTIKLWDPATGRLLKTLYGHKSNITTVDFSPRGNYLLSASVEDGTNRIWNLQTGQEIIQLQRLAFPQKQVSISNDEKWAATLLNEGIGLWNLQTGKLIDSFKVQKEDGSFHYFSFTAISNDGKLIAAYDYNYHKIFIWDRVTIKLLKEINMNINSYGAYNISFAANNKQVYLLTSNYFIAANIATGKTIYISEPHTAGFGEPVISGDGRFLFTGGTEKLYKIVDNDTMETNSDERYFYQPSLLNLQTFKSIRLQGEKPPGDIVETKIDKAGKAVMVVTYDSIFVYSIVADKLILNGHISRDVSQFYGIIYKNPEISPDGKHILTITSYDVPALYDNKGKWVSVLTGLIDYDGEQYFSDDGNNIFTTTGNEEKFSWDIQTGKLTGQYDSSKKKYVLGKTIDPYKYVRFDSASGQMGIETNKKKVILQGETAKKIEGRYSLDNNYFITFNGGDSILKVWDAQTGKLFYKVKSKFGDYSRPVLSDDNRYIALVVSNASAQLDIMWNNLQKELDGDSAGFKTKANSPTEIRVLELVTGKEVLYLQDTSGFVYYSNVGFSARSKYFSFSTDSLTIWNTDSWQQLLKVNNSSCGNETPDWDISPDGLKIIVSCNNNSIVYQANTNQVLFALPGAVRFANFSNDGKRILTTSDDKQLKIWDAATGKLSYTFYSFMHGNYIITDEYNRYDGTEEARKKLYYVCGNEIIDLEQFKDQLWVPNLAERIMNGDSINAPKLSDLNICGLTPQVENKTNKADTYLFKITPRRGGLGETVLYINGIEVMRYPSAKLKKNGEWYELTVKKETVKNFLIAGQENTVTVKAYTTGNAISSRGAVVTSREEQKPTALPNLFAVMIGVSDYKGMELDLKYAAKDAADISAAIANAAKKLLNTDGKEHVFIYNLTTATDRYQLPEKNSIKKVLEEIGKKATANDVLFLFFAGHGVMEGINKQFYFLTADASKISAATSVADVGISTNELTEWMKPQNIKAQKRILIFDACNSGQAISDFVKIGGKDQHYLAARSDDKSKLVKAIDKLNEKSGLFILSASASDQSAYEMGRYSQGLLTYSLLKAIKQQPDILDDGKYLNVGRWFDAAEKTVSELSRETGARQNPQIVSTTNFNIGVVDEEVMTKIVLAQEKPLFTASNFQNNDEAIADDDLELSKTINLQLNDLAARGSDSKIVYVTATNSPDAYSISGRYTVKGNTITMTVNLKQNKTIKAKLEVSGTKDKLNELAREAVEKATALIK